MCSKASANIGKCIKLSANTDMRSKASANTGTCIK